MGACTGPPTDGIQDTLYAVMHIFKRMRLSERMRHVTAQVGIALVGMSSLLSGEGSAQVDVSPGKMLLGMGLIVASQVSLQFYPGCKPLVNTGSTAQID